MESKRQQKFAKLLQKELAEIFQRELTHVVNGAYISISTVRVSPDLGTAKVYLSLILAGDGKAILQEVKVNTKIIRHALAQRIKNQVRVIPDLIFYLDDSAEYAAHMDKIFSGLDIPPADEKEPEEDDDATY
ncbi:30S ribosome-binding factor RbfA [Adhaeribacter aquaticus]|uniref:30S ribosome-binding factor RbfA n=1 Tax=Adhaeribacter aquaticus TaxID=299567 RepID=UPI0004141A71|nr:30S ribosome-binding factor RbfA [Adhaeribacter aquaticus]